jgi:hypothetical protein
MPSGNDKDPVGPYKITRWTCLKAMAALVDRLLYDRG